MKRLGFSLIEILVSLVIFGIVATMALSVFQYQSESFKTESDKAEVALAAKGTLDELTRAVRVTGGGLPQGSGGIKVWGNGEDRVTFVTNETRWTDTVRGFVYLPTRNELRIAIDSAANFSDSGYVRLALTCPPQGQHAPPASLTLKTFTLRILDRVASSGKCGDSLILNATELVSAPNSWDKPGDVRAAARTLVYNTDSLHYRKSQDTLYFRQNRQGESPYAVGVDTMIFKYWHPVAGWKESLSNIPPANRVEKVLIRLVLRSSKPNSKLLKQDPNSRGYHFVRMETEVALRNDSLINR